MTEKLITKEKLLELLKTAIEVAGTQTAWARKHGFSQVYVSRVLSEQIEPGPKILEALGLSKKVYYVKEED